MLAGRRLKSKQTGHDHNNFLIISVSYHAFPTNSDEENVHHSHSCNKIATLMNTIQNKINKQRKEATDRHSRIRPFASVAPHVDFQGLFLCEFLVALSTGECLEAHMGHLMALAVTFGRECLVAHRTSKWTLTCVDSHVGCKTETMSVSALHMLQQ